MKPKNFVQLVRHLFEDEKPSSPLDDVDIDLLMKHFGAEATKPAAPVAAAPAATVAAAPVAAAPAAPAAPKKPVRKKSSIPKEPTVSSGGQLPLFTQKQLGPPSKPPARTALYKTIGGAEERVKFLSPEEIEREDASVAQKQATFKPGMYAQTNLFTGHRDYDVGTKPGPAPTTRYLHHGAPNTVERILAQLPKRFHGATCSTPGCGNAAVAVRYDTTELTGIPKPIPGTDNGTPDNPNPAYRIFRLLGNDTWTTNNKGLSFTGGVTVKQNERIMATPSDIHPLVVGPLTKSLRKIYKNPALVPDLSEAEHRSEYDRLASRAAHHLKLTVGPVDTHGILEHETTDLGSSAIFTCGQRGCAIVHRFDFENIDGGPARRLEKISDRYKPLFTKRELQAREVMHPGMPVLVSAHRRYHSGMSPETEAAVYGEIGKPRMPYVFDERIPAVQREDGTVGGILPALTHGLTLAIKDNHPHPIVSGKPFPELTDAQVDAINSSGKYVIKSLMNPLDWETSHNMHRLYMEGRRLYRDETTTTPQTSAERGTRTPREGQEEYRKSHPTRKGQGSTLAPKEKKSPIYRKGGREAPKPDEGDVANKEIQKKMLEIRRWIKQGLIPAEHLDKFNSSLKDSIKSAVEVYAASKKKADELIQQRQEASLLDPLQGKKKP